MIERISCNLFFVEVQNVLKEYGLLPKNSNEYNKILCLAYTMNADEFTMCARLNTTGSYFEANKQVQKIYRDFVQNGIFSIF